MQHNVGCGLFHDARKSVFIPDIALNGPYARFDLRKIEQVRACVRRQGKAGDFRAQMLQPQGQPATLEPCMSGQNIRLLDQNVRLGPTIFSMARSPWPTALQAAVSRAAYPSAAKSHYACKR